MNWKRILSSAALVISVVIVLLIGWMTASMVGQIAGSVLASAVR